MRTGNKGVRAIVLHPTEDVVTAVDTHGVVHVMTFAAGRDVAAHHLNCFNIATGQNYSPARGSSSGASAMHACTITTAHILNGLEWPMLMACAADGAVRIWARCVSTALCRDVNCLALSTAWCGHVDPLADCVHDVVWSHRPLASQAVSTTWRGQMKCELVVCDHILSL